MGLLLSGKITPPIGTYAQVGRVSLDGAGIPHCKVFFPVAEPVAFDRKLQAPYTRPVVVESLIEATEAVKWLANSTIGKTKHPFLTEANLEQTFALPEDLPLVVFSHGLFGSGDQYSKLCGDVASCGAVVVSLEHSDGSGVYAQLDGKEVLYDHPTMEYTRPNVLEFRGKQLLHRKAEIQAVLELITKQEERELTPLQARVFGKINKQNIFLAGHSFGGCSTVNTAFAFEKDNYLNDAIQGYLLFDIWPMPLRDEILDQGLKKPFISIRSEGFVTGKEGQYTTRLVKASNSSCKLNAYIDGIIHEQFSDVPWYTALRFIRRKAGMVGKTKRRVSERVIVEAANAFIKSPTDFDKESMDEKELSKLLLAA